MAANGEAWLVAFEEAWVVAKEGPRLVEGLWAAIAEAKVIEKINLIHE